MFHQALGSRESCVYLCADPTKALLPPWLDAGDPWGFLGILQSSEVMNGTTIWPPALPGFDLNAQNYGEYFRHL
jgi:hypothetical protein